MNATTVYGLEITDLEPILDEFGWTHTAYYETMEAARQAAQPYIRAGNYRLAIKVEVYDGRAWDVRSREEVA